MGKEVAKAQGEDKQALLARTKHLSAEVKTLQATADETQVELDRLLRTIGNVVEPEVPVGGEDDYVVVETIGSARDFAAEGFEPRDHLALAEGLDAIDMERGAKVAGARFYFLKGVGARLEMGLLALAMNRAIAAGFVPLITPTLVKSEVMAGAGFLDHHADEVYRLEADDLYLTPPPLVKSEVRAGAGFLAPPADGVYRLGADALYLPGPSEVALAGYPADEVIDLSAGPIRYAGQSPCYRREAGSYGKDTRG